MGGCWNSPDLISHCVAASWFAIATQMRVRTSHPKILRQIPLLLQPSQFSLAHSLLDCTLWDLVFNQIVKHGTVVNLVVSFICHGSKFAGHCSYLKMRGRAGRVFIYFM